MIWIPTDARLPAPETEVLILLNGAPRIAALFWERAAWDETFEDFLYWDDPNDDGQIWNFCDVSHWAPLPDLPGFDEGIEAAFWSASQPPVKPRFDFSDMDT